MSQEPSTCAYCGAPLSITARFCDSCGQPVQAQAGSIPPPVYTQTSQAEPPAPKAAEPAPQYPPPEAHPAPVKKGRLALPLVLGIVIACLCCVVAAALVAGAWAFLIPVQQSGPIELPGVEIGTEIFEIMTLVPEMTSIPELLPATPEPTGTAEEQAVRAANVDYEGVSFYLDPRIADGIMGEVIPASSEGEQAYFAIYPETVQIKFAGYSLEDTFHDAQVNVYPVEAYADMNEAAREEIEGLRQVLANPSGLDSDDSLPFLPIWGAAQIMQAQFETVDFLNGSGIRFLTQYGQDVYPINNNSMFYTFQGLTDDEAYYVAAIFPASHPSLQGAEELANSPNWADTFEAYLTTTELMLDIQDPGSFTPDLKVLDELIASMEIVR